MVLAWAAHKEWRSGPVEIEEIGRDPCSVAAE